MDGIRKATTEADNDLLRRALAGDQQAKQTIEARELMVKVDNMTLDLKVKAEKGDAQALARLRSMAAGSSAGRAAAAPAASSGASAAELVAAKTSATTAERSRWVAVFASEASKGRERNCAILLGGDRFWSASSIIAELPHLPTDAESARKGSRARSDALWDKANARIGRAAPKPEDPTEARQANGKAEDLWVRARAKVRR